MRLFNLLFFVSLSILAQNKKIEVTLNSISDLPISANKVEYHIQYQIENKTANEISFFLLPNALIAHAASSLTLYPVYKMYQNGVFEDMDGPFFEYETELELEYAKIEDKTSEAATTIVKKLQKQQEAEALSYYTKFKESNSSSDVKWFFQRQKLLDNIVTLQPNEIKLFTIKTLWDKNRHIKNDDLEYYLDENNTIEIELILDLKTNLFKDKLSKEDVEKINANPNFIEGEFKSNKLKVNFKG
jgi:hypothetical protein